MSDDKDRAQSDAATCGIRRGQIWKHYKGGLYTIVETAVKEDTLEPLIVYQSNKTGGVWARTLSNWVERVYQETEYTLPDGSKRMGRPRFTRVTE
jgi:hypothetical protein